MYIHIYIYVYVCVYIHTFIYKIHINTPTHTHTNIHTHTHTHTHTCSYLGRWKSRPHRGPQLALCLQPNHSAYTQQKTTTSTSNAPPSLWQKPVASCWWQISRPDMPRAPVVCASFVTHSYWRHTHSWLKTKTSCVMLIINFEARYATRACGVWLIRDTTVLKKYSFVTHASEDSPNQSWESSCTCLETETGILLVEFIDSDVRLEIHDKSVQTNVDEWTWWGESCRDMFI